MRDSTVRASVEAAATSVRRTVRRSARAVRQGWRTATPQRRRTWQLSAGATAAGLALACTAVVLAGPWDSGQRTAERARAAPARPGSGGKHIPGAPAPAPSAPEVLSALGSGDGPDSSGSTGSDNAPPAPTPSALADALVPLLEDSALGTVRTASVVDAVSGRELFGRSAKRAATPASTVKLATGVAALSARGSGHRVPTRVVRADGDGVVLVGGGDPTLTSGDLDRLAARTARALRPAADGERAGEDEGGDRRKAKVSLGYDTTLYSGPELHSIGPNENLAPVTALMVDQARSDDSDHGPAPRATDPAAEAAEEFADGLREHGVRVSGDPRSRTAPDDARELAVHRSAPLSALVEEMLTHSDNDIAEALARQTALGGDEPAGFAGAGRAVRDRLAELGLPVKGAHFADGSGLSRSDRVSARLLTGLLTVAADGRRPELRAVLTGLPVAGFTGTLGSRYADRDAHGAGVVRAKTGTLTGVNTLAGTVVDADGRLLAFAFMSTGTKDRDGAQEVLDRLASTLAGCGCR